MTVEDLLRDLAYAELKNLAMSDSGSIRDEDVPTIMVHANDSLLRLYSRFVLRTNEVLIQEVEHITAYRLSSQYSRSTGDANKEHFLYIVDLPEEPFLDDAIKIMEIRDETGYRYPLNDPENCRSLYTPEPLVIQDNAPRFGKMLSVIYQARHPKLEYTDYEAVINLPDILVKALRSSIAAKVYSGMNGQDNIAKSMEQEAIYENICAEVIDRDLVNSTYSFTNARFNLNGWV